jgi:hypothetical protein
MGRARRRRQSAPLTVPEIVGRRIGGNTHFRPGGSQCRALRRSLTAGSSARSGGRLGLEIGKAGRRPEGGDGGPPAAGTGRSGVDRLATARMPCGPLVPMRAVRSCSPATSSVRSPVAGGGSARYAPPTRLARPVERAWTLRRGRWRRSTGPHARSSDSYGFKSSFGAAGLVQPFPGSRASGPPGRLSEIRTRKDQRRSVISSAAPTGYATTSPRKVSPRDPTLHPADRRADHRSPAERSLPTG